jgi:hypothetical protein
MESKVNNSELMLQDPKSYGLKNCCQKCCRYAVQSSLKLGLQHAKAGKRWLRNEKLINEKLFLQ